jgi:tRNA threonylcarbamoyladenosine biosynthesis protein TsaB
MPSQPLILLIESSQEVCSVSLASQERILTCLETAEPNMHSAMLAEYASQSMIQAGIVPGQLSAIAVSRGPGSYTGLRIGASLAKGLCFGLGLPLIAIDTLQAMASSYAASTDLPAGCLLCPTIDARRMEVYAAIYTARLDCVRNVEAEVIDEMSYSRYLSTGKLIFVGSGADKCRSVIASPNAVFVPGFQHSSRGLAALAWQKYANKKFEDIAYFEPLYLKEFIATVSKKRFFG